ncbi:MAG: hypothetical protein JWP38_673 [Herbaspirillum sp.]|jgi:hypothetical protein|nr:hypothetical protein [Herbaspirillum sp.]
MGAMVVSFWRAVLSLLHIRMLLLTLLPFVLSLVLWGVVLWLGLQPLVDGLQSYFIVHDMFGISGSILNWFSMGALKTVIVPLIAMWALLPLMILTALVFVALLAVPAIVRHVAGRHYPHLARKYGGSWWGTLWTSLWCFLVFAALWVLTLPLLLAPPLNFAVHPLLWGWLTYRVMAYDALADHADADERRIIMRRHRWPLLGIGTVAGILGTAPTLFWLGSALSSWIFFPFFAGISVWLYVLVFVFGGLWFQYYCMEALGRHRAGAGDAGSAEDTAIQA